VGDRNSDRRKSADDGSFATDVWLGGAETPEPRGDLANAGSYLMRQLNYFSLTFEKKSDRTVGRQGQGGTIRMTANGETVGEGHL
jgi:hypothetical protein